MDKELFLQAAALFFVGDIPFLVSLLTFFFDSHLVETLLAKGLVSGMTDLEEGNYLIHCHFVVLFLLLNKLVSMFIGKGVKEDQVTFLLANGEFIISLEVVVQFEEDLEARSEGLWNHVVAF